MALPVPLVPAEELIIKLNAVGVAGYAVEESVPCSCLFFIDTVLRHDRASDRAVLSDVKLPPTPGVF